MAEDNIKDFAINFILAGVILMGLLTYTFLFTYNNNPNALGQNAEQLNIINNNFSNSLTEIEISTNIQFNTSAQLNSQDSILGSSSASSTSYGFMGQTQDTWTIMKTMIAWAFAGTFGQLLIKILGGLISLAGLYYVIKLIRSLF